jgi:protein-disulfide isomerase
MPDYKKYEQPARKRSERTAKAAALRAEQERREQRRRVLTILGVGLVMVAIVAAAIVVGLVQKKHEDAALEKGVAAASGAYSVVIGPDSAPHHVVIYEDFLCPFCGQLEAGSRDRLAQLADDGKVQVEYRPFNLLGGNDTSSYSVRSAGAFSIVLDKAGPAVAKKFHDLLYEHQPSEQGPFPSDADLVKDAVEAGAKEAAVKGPIESGAGEAWVADATREALAAGLNGTPTVLVDGKVLASTTASDLLDAVS